MPRERLQARRRRYQRHGGVGPEHRRDRHCGRYERENTMSDVTLAESEESDGEGDEQLAVCLTDQSLSGRRRWNLFACPGQVQHGLT